MTGIDLSARLGRLHTALMCDVLDRLGHLDTFLGPAIRPLHPGTVVAGRAFPLRAAAVDRRPERPYAQLLAAYEHMHRGDVVVIGAEGELRSGLWGELLSVAARARGVVGAVTDGLVRDPDQIGALGFPVFAAGTSPLDSDGRQEVVAFGEPARCGDALVRPGDFILGDAMGVVVIPADVAAEAVALAEEKRDGESTVRAELEAGEDIGMVFSRHGIL